jgi:vacuolar-type H+-ATPase catalytic subunit A/Vma1
MEKEDFSPFDIYQHIDKNKKSAFMEQQEDESETAINKDLPDLLRSTEKQILLFSGSLSWANLKQNHFKTIDIFEELARRNVPIKVIANINLDSMANVKKFLAINDRIGKQLIEIRHREQPLMAIVIDSRLARFKEIRKPSTEKKKKTFIFYCIYDGEWIEWIQKIFWNLFSTAIPAEKRLDEIETIQKIS